MEEIDIEICLTKINKDYQKNTKIMPKEYQKDYRKAKKEAYKIFVFLLLHSIKWNKKL